MLHDSRRIFRIQSEASWVFLGQSGVALGGLFGIKILTQVLDPAEFGRLALANTMALLVGTNLFGPLTQGIMRYWSISREQGATHRFMFHARRYVRVMGWITGAAGMLASVLAGLYFGLAWARLLFLSLIAGMAMGWLGVRIAILSAARERKTVALVNSANAFGKQLLAAACALLIIATAESVMLGYTLALAAALLWAEVRCRQTVAAAPLPPGREADLPPESDEAIGRGILRFSWPFFIWSGFAWVHQSCDRWALQAFHGADVVGTFAVISQLSVYPLVFGSGFLNTLFIPIAYERACALDSPEAVRSAQTLLLWMIALYVMGAAVLVSGFALFHRPVVLAVSNPGFGRFSHLLPGLAAAWALYYLGQMLSGFGLLLNRPQQYILPILVSGLVALVAAFLLSARWGPAGVVWALGIAGFLYALWFVVIALGMFRSPAGA